MPNQHIKNNLSTYICYDSANGTIIAALVPQGDYFLQHKMRPKNTKIVPYIYIFSVFKLKSTFIKI